MISALVRRGWPSAAQERRLATMSLVDSVGTGLFVAMVPVFLIGHLGTDASQVGWALSAGGAALLLVTVPAGVLADRVSLSTLYTVGSVAQAAASAILATGPGFAVSASAIVLAGLGVGVVAPPRSVIVARAAPPEDLVRVRAYNRSVFQIGMALGSGCAALVIWTDDTRWYAAGFAVNALTFLVNSALVRLVGEYEAPAATAALAAEVGAGHPTEPTRDEPTPVWRDRPFLVVAAINAVLFFTAAVVDPVIAIFVVSTDAGLAAVVPLLLTLNTVLTVILQVPLSRPCVGADGVRRGQRRAGVAVLVGTLLLALAADRQDQTALLLLLALAVTALTVAEVYISAASWEASFRLAPRDAQGRYFSTFNLGPGLAQALGPGLLTPLVLLGSAGWVVIGVVLSFTGLLGAGVSARAIARRTPTTASALAAGST